MINSSKGTIAAILTLLVSVMSLFTAVYTVSDNQIYHQVYEAGTISEFLIAGSLAQDMLVIPTSVIILFLSLFFLKRRNFKILISILGLIGYIFYAYGLYVIQGQYSSLYLLYLAIFGLSIYAMIYGLISFQSLSTARIELPAKLRIIIAVFLLLVIGILAPILLTQIGKDIAEFTPSQTYAVYVLDLAIEFPAFVIVAIMLFKNTPFGNILAGIVLFKVLSVCLSVAFGEWYVAFYRNFDPDYGMLSMFAVLTVLSSLLLTAYFTRIRIIPSMT